MQISEPHTLLTFIDAFNESESSTDRLAYATGVRAELVKYLTDLDESIIPLFQNAVVRELHAKTDKK